MQIRINTNIAQVQRALQQQASQVPFALSVALNRTAIAAQSDLKREMATLFDRPTPYFLNSPRVIRATKTRLQATVWFKDRNSVENSSDLALPHIKGGDRAVKPMEQRLQRAGLMPAGWRAVPGQGADLDIYGNMSRGQISQLLNVLGTYREAGYNKANAATRARLAKGNVKRNVYGFEYFVNPVGSARGRHLLPGVYKRVRTAFGTSLKPVLIFVRSTRYKARLDFEGIVKRAVDQRFPVEFDAAFDQAVRTARP